MVLGTGLRVDDREHREDNAEDEHD